MHNFKLQHRILTWWPVVYTCSSKLTYCYVMMVISAVLQILTYIFSWYSLKHISKLYIYCQLCILSFSLHVVCHGGKEFY